MKNQDLHDYLIGRKTLSQLTDTMLNESPEVKLPDQNYYKVKSSYCYNQDGLCEEDNCR